MENGVNWKNVVGLEIGGDHKNKSRNILVLEEPSLGGVPRAFLVMVRNQVVKGSPCNWIQDPPHPLLQQYKDIIKVRKHATPGIYVKPDEKIITHYLTKSWYLHHIMFNCSTPYYNNSDSYTYNGVLGRCADNQNGNSSTAPVADCQLFSHVQSHLNYYIYIMNPKLSAKHVLAVREWF